MAEVGAGFPVALPAVEQVRADHGDFGHAVRPVGHHIVRVVVRGVADRRVDRSVQSGGGDFARGLPGSGVGGAVEGAVARKRELAAGAFLRPLIDDAADRIGKGVAAHAVEDHLRDGAFAVGGFVAGFVVDRLRQALFGALLGGAGGGREGGGGGSGL